MVGIAWPQRSWPFTGGWYKNVPLHARWVMGGDGTAAQIRGIDSLLQNKLDLELTVGGGSLPGRFRADVEVDGAKTSSSVSVGPDEHQPLRLQKNLPTAGDEPRVTKLLVRGPQGQTVFEGEWKFQPGLQPSGRPPREKEKPFPSQVNYAAEAKAIRFWADVLDYPKRAPLSAARVTVFPKGQSGREVAKTEVTDFAYDQVEGYLWLPKNLAVGEYVVRFEFVDEAGRVLDSQQKSFQAIDLKKTFHWWDSRVGTRYTVKPEFEPIRVSGNRLTVWGRTYEFRGGPFPTTIASLGAQMLARPISLVVETEQGPQVCQPPGQHPHSAHVGNGSPRSRAVAATTTCRCEPKGGSNSTACSRTSSRSHPGGKTWRSNACI